MDSRCGQVREEQKGKSEKEYLLPQNGQCAENVYEFLRTCNVEPAPYRCIYTYFVFSLLSSCCVDCSFHLFISAVVTYNRWEISKVLKSFPHHTLRNMPGPCIPGCWNHIRGSSSFPDPGHMIQEVPLAFWTGRLSWHKGVLGWGSSILGFFVCLFTPLLLSFPQKGASSFPRRWRRTRFYAGATIWFSFP